MHVEYRSNNSGGDWWLTDDDWRALEAAGWEIRWFAANRDVYRTLDAEGRFIGALADSAIRRQASLRDAVDEWERVTGKSSLDAGCPCCGQPHWFTEYDDNGDYVTSGPDVEYSSWAWDR